MTYCAAHSELELRPMAAGSHTGMPRVPQGIARLLIERIDFDGSVLKLSPKDLVIREASLPRAA